MDNSNISTSKPQVFDYFDYREYLKESVEYNKFNKSNFSLRRFNKECGFNSPNYIQSILKGDRSLTDKSINGVSQALELDDSELLYLKKLIHFNECKNEGEKRIHLKELVEFKVIENADELEASQSIFLSEWYYSAIYCLIESKLTLKSPNEFARELRISIDPLEVGKALSVLEKIGLIRFDKENGYVVTGKSLTADKGIPVELFNHYHKNFLDLSKWAVDEVEPEDKCFFGSTINIKEEKVREAKTFLINMRKKFRALFDDSEGDFIYHLESTFFPLQKKKDQK